MAEPLYNFHTMNFEYNSNKSTVNLAKHGIDFAMAQSLWLDPDLLAFPVKTVDKPIYLVIAKLAGRHWSAVITYRKEMIRIISVRRSRQEEITLYEH